ncbi:acyl-CoA dehydrogenase family protein [uncultured Intestinimonas sp.]|uniref:acyl-CoA dehydrogenase family protein n=1 Tax=uncultured Intestinimonas sp. TaxID=1689265 RepID=UPI0025D7A421|nr:acyl-CoA dehydrogenase family protein [uncultured Intestinimonas sp.]
MYKLMTDEEREYVELLHDVQMKELQPLVQECDEKGLFPMSVHDKLGELGFHGMDVPEEYGGLGLSSMANYFIREELGYVDAGFGFSYALSKGAQSTVLRVGTEEQKKFICDRILNGSIGCNCITEAGAGSEVTAMRTTAVKDGTDYIINGTKSFISNAPIADIFMVVAYTDKEKGPKGMSLFMVEKERGVKTGKKENKMGLRSSETGEVIFEDVRVPAKNMIGPEGLGYRNILATLARSRIVNTAIAVGIAQRALDEAVKYSNERVTFGKLIKKHQGVQFMLADMEIQVQAARQYLLYGVRMMDAGQDIAMASSGGKVFASEAAMKVTTDAVQVLGGYGYSKEYPVEKLMRDAKIFSIFEGTNQINRMVLGGALTKI